uniref:Uncharacterized protein n=1 Tax=Anguilla anguilla TaxID=7936 RepID=A0A0E9RGE6_ANGAN
MNHSFGEEKNKTNKNMFNLARYWQSLLSARLSD